MGTSLAACLANLPAAAAVNAIAGRVHTWLRHPPAPAPGAPHIPYIPYIPGAGEKGSGGEVSGPWLRCQDHVVWGVAVTTVFVGASAALGGALRRARAAAAAAAATAAAGKKVE